MGKVHKTRTQRPGYNTYKTIVALRLASRKEGVTTHDLSTVAGCSVPAAAFTLKHLVNAGECAKTEKDGETTRFYSDVYADIPNGDFMRISVDMPEAEQDINPPDTYKDAVIGVVLETQKEVLDHYPVSIFGEQGMYVTKLINGVAQKILARIQEIT